MVNGLHLYSAFLVFSTTQSALHYKRAFTHSHTFTHWWRWLSYKLPTAHQEANHSYTFTHRWRSHRGQIGVKYLAQGHIDMELGGAGNRTADPPTGGRLLYLWATAAPGYQDLINKSATYQQLQGTSADTQSSLKYDMKCNQKTLFIEHLSYIVKYNTKCFT